MSLSGNGILKKEEKAKTPENQILNNILNELRLLKIQVKNFLLRIAVIELLIQKFSEKDEKEEESSPPFSVSTDNFIRFDDQLIADACRYIMFNNSIPFLFCCSLFFYSLGFPYEMVMNALNILYLSNKPCNNLKTLCTYLVKVSESSLQEEFPLPQIDINTMPPTFSSYLKSLKVGLKKKYESPF